jgi:hypothetical protein
MMPAERGSVSFLLDIAVDTDARHEAERIRAAVAEAVRDATVTAGVAGPKSGATEDPDARLAVQLAILGSRVVLQRPTRRTAS